MPTDLANERRTFWPRAGPVGIVPDLGDDRPCPSCGYNLRGLMYDSACPECGAVAGIEADIEPIPWNDQRNAGTYFRTLALVLASPKELGAHIWKRDMLWMRSARRFRGINITLATISICAAIFTVTAELANPVVASLAMPVAAMSVLWWLISITAEPVRYFDDKGEPVARMCAGVLSAYLSAPFALSPLHLVLIALPLPQNDPYAIVTRAALHLFFILIQLLLMASAESAITWQLVEIPRATAFMMSLGNMFVRSIKAIVYIVLIPMMAGSLANSFAHG